jgi:hypothetical protein
MASESAKGEDYPEWKEKEDQGVHKLYKVRKGGQGLIS